MDPEVLSEYSRFVDEGNLRWVPVPANPLIAREIGIDERWMPTLTADVLVKDRVLRLWDGLSPFLPRTLAALSEKTSALAILQTSESGVSLVYFLGSGTDVSVRRAYSPSKAFPSVSNRFPVDLKPLYQLHDGFVNFMSGDGGPLPVREWQTLIDKDSGEPSLVKIAMDGSEAFGFDVSESPAVGYVLRPDDGEVEEVTDAWTFLDDLMASRIEDL